MDPNVLAKAHSGIAIIVVLLYIFRGGLMLAGSTKLRSVMLTAICHIFVLVLILMGLYTAYLKGLPFSSGFISTKLLCFISFVILGSVALKHGLSKPIASILWLVGLLALIYAYLLGNHIAPALF